MYQVGAAAVIVANGGVYAAAYANGYLNAGIIGNTLTRFETLKGIVDWRVPGVYRVTPAYLLITSTNLNTYAMDLKTHKVAFKAPMRWWQST